MLVPQSLPYNKSWRPRRRIVIKPYSFFMLYLQERDPVPTVQEVGWAPACLDRYRKSCLPLGFEPQTIQPIASRYIDYAILTAIQMAVPYKSSHLYVSFYPELGHSHSEQQYHTTQYYKLHPVGNKLHCLKVLIWIPYYKKGYTQIMTSKN